ncbi:hypothetical protein QSV34_09085 [Porticoccus sp. W117]|uniref:hypothetical protein n=1 Tax=Porticoccus sp. W117 TaxID=3054777 RepID=UPI00259A1834|nr:hypothetical protein [Porticoccus sp. W117]MDM3871509.1 hypothetical protein [Porticoccus sp. W117]
MENSDVYKAPESELVSGDELKSIGGWLRFFQVVNFIYAIAGVLVAALVVVTYFIDESVYGGLIGSIASLVELTPVIVFSILILKVVNHQEEGIPVKIKSYIGYYLLTSFLVAAGIASLYIMDLVPDKPASIFGDLIYYLIWSSYFKRSKRVRSFYGATA